VYAQMNAFACSLALSAGLAFSGPPPSTDRVETVMQDDAALLYRSPAQVRRSLRRMARLGVDRVRITASWRRLAPHREWRTRPFFDATDSSQYDRAAMANLDRAVKGARAEGMQVMLDLGFFAPRWAAARGGAGGRNVWRPSAREFGRFARAMAERYDGRTPDPAHRSRRLPAVRLWTTWNEPNHRVFLRPQWQRVRGRWQAESPHLYRRLHEAAYPEIKAVSPRNRVLIGGLSSEGDPGHGAARSIAPLRFTRELACVDARLRPLRRAECRGFRPLRADGFALHPYSLHTIPGATDARLDRVQIGELGKLTTLLTGLRRAGRLAQPLPLYLTEYGYQSAPPDPGGIPGALQAAYSGQALFLAWRSAEVRTFPQFLLYDIGPDRSKPRGSRARWGGYQTGLYTYDGRPKRQVVRGFELPFSASAVQGPRGPAAVAVLGQVRPGYGAQAVQLQRRGVRGGWTDVGCPTATDGQGIYRRTVAYQGAGAYRVVWRSRGRQTASPDSTVGDPVAIPESPRAALARRP
jgi:Cellulase (glycosyl hydrolase family 5)